MTTLRKIGNVYKYLTSTMNNFKGIVDKMAVNGYTKTIIVWCGVHTYIVQIENAV